MSGGYYYYLGRSDVAFQRRWTYPPYHLVARGTQPARGTRGSSLCGVWMTVMQTPYEPGREHVCKRCHGIWTKVNPREED